ncbi:NAD(P)/FAD-dependent oxidoreductase [Streptosporangium carneum]|uniref:FAD-binding protein n=1 Tax=Streptosporangium carneum TaxID=47481 RepID=A0A9W6I2V7_9ACTN|nr:NAD(P)/FAD-dependent oxidoreductase [Streptosporangium carneum]GLK11025.1 FAD-binding protein [Streptosporangium carneum]
MRESTQILIIGGGPAGSTAAGLLAKEGFQVTLLERDRFPRYHIGESILPSCRPIFEMLGVWDKVEAHGFQPKGGAFFQWGPEEWEVLFSDMGDDTPNAWQVVRSEFDQLLLDHARELGVEVVEGVSVRDVEFDGDRAVAARWHETKDPSRGGVIRFGHVIDASGRGGLLATRHLRSRRFHDVFRNVAAWAYWRNAKPLGKGPKGAIAVCSVKDGWFWAIPLHDGTLSVGLVTGRDLFNDSRGRLNGDIQAVYDEALAGCPTVLDMLDGAEQVTGMKVEQDYSYVSESFAGPGYLLAGDAACFLDPLLSTGVHLATYSAMLGAASLASVLRGEASEQDAWRFYQTVYRHAYQRLLVLVSVFYESYRGKEHHFYNAQRLTSDERDHLNLQAAFDRIVTGVADLNDAEQAYRLVQEHLHGSGSGDPNPLNNLNRVQEIRQSPFDPANAVDGLYLVTRPRLGLRSVEAPAPDAP